jgi:hypothetical protein
MSVWRRWADGLDNPIVVKEGVSRMRTWAGSAPSATPG